MGLVPLKCKVLLQDWDKPTPDLIVGGKSVQVVDTSGYLSSFIIPGGRMTEETSVRIRKPRVIFAELYDIWHQKILNCLQRKY